MFKVFMKTCSGSLCLSRIGTYTYPGYTDTGLIWSPPTSFVPVPGPGEFTRSTVEKTQDKRVLYLVFYTL